MITVLETDNWRIDQPLSADDVQQYSKHSAWCTKDNNYANQYFDNGKLYALKKKGKRRYSYQLYCNNSVVEIEHKSGRDINLNEFMGGDGAEISEFLADVTKEAVKHYENARLGFNVDTSGMRRSLTRLGESFSDLGVASRSAAEGLARLGENLTVVELIDVLHMSYENHNDEMYISGDMRTTRNRSRKFTLELADSYENNEAISQVVFGEKASFSIPDHMSGGRSVIDGHLTSITRRQRFSGGGTLEVTIETQI